jgi:hypothetical protein
MSEKKKASIMAVGAIKSQAIIVPRDHLIPHDNQYQQPAYIPQSQSEPIDINQKSAG